MTGRNNSPSESRPDRNQNEILGEIKRVWELMEEDKENVSNCVDKLKEHEHRHQLLENQLIDLKTSITKNTAVVETHDDFQENVKYCNKIFLTSLQQIYTDCQQRNVNIAMYENEYEKQEKILEENDRKFDLAKKKFEMEEKELLVKLDKIKTEQIEINDKMKTNKEKNIELEYILDSLENTIEKKENEAKIMAHFKAEVDKHLELLKQADDDLAVAATMMNNFQIEQQASEEPYLLDIQQLEQRTGDLQAEISVVNLDDQKKYLEKLCKSKQDLLECTTNNTALLESRRIFLSDIKNKVTATSEDCIKKLEDKTKIIDEYEALYAPQNEIIKITDQNVNAMTDKNEELRKQIDELYLHIKNMQEDIPEVDSNLLNVKKLQLEEIKTSRKLKKDKCTNLSGALQTESTEMHNQIKEYQTDLDQLQHDCEHMETEVAQLVSNKDKLKSDLHTHETELATLEKKITSLTATHDNLKAEMSLRMKKPKSVANKRQVDPKFEASRLHWESDSSVEGVDNRIAMRNKLKLQRRKLQENQ